MPDSGLFPTDAFRRVLNEVVRAEGAALLQYSPVARLPAAPRGTSRRYLLRFGLEARAERHPDRQRLAAGLRPDRAHVHRSRRRGGHRAAHVSAGHAGVPRVRRPARGRAVGRARAAGRGRWSACWSGTRRSSSTASRRPQPDRARHDAPTRRGGCWRRGARTRCRSSRTASTAASTTGARPAAPAQGARPRRASSSTSARSRRSSFPGCGWAGSWRRRPSIERLRAAKQLADLHTSALIQAAVHRFCERRLLDRHVARVGRRVRAPPRDLLVRRCAGACRRA